jgi:hypothetical protein
MPKVVDNPGYLPDGLRACAGPELLVPHQANSGLPLEINELPAALGAVQPHRHRHHPPAAVDQHGDLGQAGGVCSWAITRTRLRAVTAGPPDRRSRSASLGHTVRWHSRSSRSGRSHAGFHLAGRPRDPGPHLRRWAEPPARLGAHGVALELLVGSSSRIHTGAGTALLAAARVGAATEAGSVQLRPVVAYGRFARAQEMIELSAGPPPYSLSPIVEPLGCWTAVLPIVLPTPTTRGQGSSPHHPHAAPPDCPGVNSLK